MNSELKRNKKSAFTLAETMIVVVVLGIIASMTVPTLIARQRETARKTTIKKAMDSYNSVIQQLVINNNLKYFSSALSNWYNNNCSRATEFFKKTATDPANPDCRFRASDGLWWDISDITKVVVAFSLDDLNSEKANDVSNNEAFLFVTEYNSNTKAYTTNERYSGYSYKVYNFIGMTESLPESCSGDKIYMCALTNNNPFTRECVSGAPKCECSDSNGIYDNNCQKIADRDCWGGNDCSTYTYPTIDDPEVGPQQFSCYKYNDYDPSCSYNYTPPATTIPDGSYQCDQEIYYYGSNLENRDSYTMYCWGDQSNGNGSASVSDCWQDGNDYRCYSVTASDNGQNNAYLSDCNATTKTCNECYPDEWNGHVYSDCEPYKVTINGETKYMYQQDNSVYDNR